MFLFNLSKLIKFLKTKCMAQIKPFKFKFGKFCESLDLPAASAVANNVIHKTGSVHYASRLRGLIDSLQQHRTTFILAYATILFTKSQLPKMVPQLKSWGRSPLVTIVSWVLLPVVYQRIFVIDVCWAGYNATHCLHPGVSATL